jgi:hypothetical protein
MLFAGPVVREFDLVQTGMAFTVGLLADGDRDVAITRVTAELDKLWQSLDVVPPTLNFTDWQPSAPGVKRRRVRLAHAPEGLPCTF